MISLNIRVTMKDLWQLNRRSANRTGYDVESIRLERPPERRWLRNLRLCVAQGKRSAFPSFRSCYEITINLMTNTNHTDWRNHSITSSKFDNWNGPSSQGKKAKALMTTRFYHSDFFSDKLLIFPDHFKGWILVANCQNRQYLFA